MAIRTPVRSMISALGLPVSTGLYPIGREDAQKIFQFHGQIGDICNFSKK